MPRGIVPAAYIRAAARRLAHDPLDDCEMTVPDRYFAALGAVPPTSIIADWLWALDSPCTLLSITKMGDAFLVDSTGAVLFLDTVGGSAERVAPTVGEFASVLESGTYDENWFMPELVDEMESRGEALQPGQCYSFKLPPVVGGKIDTANLHAISALVHFSMGGQLHEQVRHMPEGSRITRFELRE